MNGFLIVDKPAGMTSHDAVSLCRRRLGIGRIGHAGTLDPDATGVLVLGIGRGTRLLQFLSGDDKEYVAQAVFGIETTSQDASGEVVAERDASRLDEETLEKALRDLTGEIDQVPPMMSAVRVGGERLYKKALRGEEVGREPRRITVTTFACESFRPGPKPTARLRIVCSKGTYVRTLVHDVGRALGVGAHVSKLRRIRSGAFGVGEAVVLDDVAADKVRPMEFGVASFPARDADESEVRDILHGKRIAAGGIDGVYALHGPSGLVAMMRDVGGEARSVCVVAEQ